jgi:hypothetical protein
VGRGDDRLQAQGPGEERGDLGSRDRVVRTETVGSAAGRDARRVQGGDLVVEGAGRIGERVSRGGRQIEAAGEERRHLASRHRIVRAEPGLGATSRHTGRREPGDVADEHRIGGVGEGEGVARRQDAVEGTMEEGSHLAPRGMAVRAEQSRAASVRDAVGVDRLDGGLVDIPVVVRERASRR